MLMTEPIDVPCGMARFLEEFRGKEECSIPLIASYENHVFLSFEVIHPFAVWVQWIYVPQQNRKKGALRRLLTELIRCSNKSNCPVYLFPREFAYLEWDPNDWPKTLESQAYCREENAPNTQELDKIYRRYEFETAHEIVNSHEDKENGRVMLVYRGKSKPIPETKDLLDLYRGRISLEHFIEKFGNG